jgi:hypothetical protein
VQPVQLASLVARLRNIRAGSAYGARGRTSCKRQASGSNPLTGSQVKWCKHPPRHPPWDDLWDECLRAELHRATTERVIPCLRIRQNRSAHQAPDPPQGHRQDEAAGAHRTRQAAEGSLREPYPRVRRDCREAPGRVRRDRSMGRVHAADQPGFIRRTIKPALGTWRCGRPAAPSSTSCTRG